ncbi:hypothetical protein B0J12DRAFT_765478 [Macrophomina phaseolina]|uniref:DUF7908 domain-containing protein n=1 Tax=Macrophomina phaseolina TaxID=35725 RepID=A0ABQ8FYQ5_9PEZI|nr:hypothetical protein B0J12DRAFT_765478 [Macrophomina phaseolina]
MLPGILGTSLLAGLGLLSSVGQARIVTVYETATTCFPETSALGTASTATAARSASTSSSTVFNDANIAAGKPFLLEVLRVDGSGLSRRQQPASQASWLMENGNTTTDASRAAVCSIDSNGRLHVNSYIMSVDNGVASAPFAANAGTYNINTTFSTINTKLYWNSSAFSNGTAQFYKLPVGLLDNAEVLGKYHGPPEPNRGWTPINLWARARES